MRHALVWSAFEEVHYSFHRSRKVSAFSYFFAMQKQDRIIANLVNRIQKTLAKAREGKFDAVYIQLTNAEKKEDVFMGALTLYLRQHSAKAAESMMNSYGYFCSRSALRAQKALNADQKLYQEDGQDCSDCPAHDEQPCVCPRNGVTCRDTGLDIRLVEGERPLDVPLEVKYVVAYGGQYKDVDGITIGGDSMWAAPDYGDGPERYYCELFEIHQISSKRTETVFVPHPPPPVPDT